ncbi:hypothetical protein [Paracoccus ravus]|uniref:hypothetical protein n=1 Tax=Paracoccus ravus TaxID=2447760 RepID=UPI00106E7884|nr:hypothetical protein [Paracoccus ravus]
MQIDYFGFTYNEAIAPAFILFDTGNPRNHFICHRPSGRLLELEKVMVTLEDAGYVPEKGEMGYADRWLGDHTQYGIPGLATAVYLPEQEDPDVVPPAAEFNGAPPHSLAQLMRLRLAMPATPWTKGRYAKLGDGSEVHFGRRGWQLGRAPA